jgi:chromosome segregation protein
LSIYLKSIDIFGFKTFADRTRLVFEPGISAIVGPNGSGKSNFVDAVRWVLGEQSAKQLRGARMDEVIFAGNSRRRPLGMAEVTLTFDNSDGALATPFTEVAVTRRAYRSGDGEYFLNRTQVRLRDVMDLLIGTGLGPDASAIISQGQIDAILSAKPESRREIFEEAAGTSKYQARKREAQRRLEQTDTNAVRINDVIVELAQQVPALEQAVRRAKRYRKVTGRLRDLEIVSYVRKTAQRREERAGLAGVLGVEETERAEADAKTAALQAEASKARYEEYQATIALDERNAARSNAAQGVQDLATAQAGAQARAEESERRCVAYANDVETAKRDLADAEALVETLGGELTAAREQRDGALRAAEAAARAEAEGSGRWEAAYAALRAVEDWRARAAAAAAESEAASTAARTERERIAQAGAQVESDLQAATALAESATGRAHELARAVAEHDGAVERLSAEGAAAARARDEAGARLEIARGSLEAARANVVAINARLSALREIEEQGIGVPAGVKAVVAGHKADRLKGVVGVVSDLIQVDGRFAAAIDIALGARVHDVVTSTAANAQAAIAMLDATKSGRATFLPLDLARQVALPLVRDVSARSGFVGRASELVSCSDAVRGAVDHLLRDVVVVDALDTALKLAPDLLPATIVTLGGEVVRNASITGGKGDADTGPLARRAAIAALSRDAVDAESAVLRADASFEAARTAVTAAAADVEALATRRLDIELRRRDDHGAHERALADAAQFKERIDALARGRSAAQADLNSATAAADRHAAAAVESHDTARTLEDERAAAAKQADELQHALSVLRDAHRIAAADAAALVERVAQAGDDVEAARGRVVSARKNREERIVALAGEREERERGGKELVALTAARAEADAALNAVQAEADALRAKRDELSTKARSLEERLNSQTAQRQARSLELERHRIRLAEIDAEMAMLAASFAQNPATQAECDEITARYAGFDGDADTEVRRLREELARLGNVNLNALEDQAALLERREFLQQQLADLEAARASVLAVIADIDAESLRQFNATFEKVAIEFGETFARLFNGGVGKIWLSEASDPTQAGIEIAAQPPGKKMQSLNLLSGGERAMTAVALIFAILRVRPSPFYIFDEIDAALDEANVGRFGGALTEVARSAQTIIITHNKATMTMADRIYGITMGEPGASSVLSLALEKVGA